MSDPILCEHCGRHLTYEPKNFPDHPWRHEDGFRQCSHGAEIVWGEPAKVEVPE